VFFSGLVDSNLYKSSGALNNHSYGFAAHQRPARTQRRALKFLTHARHQHIGPRTFFGLEFSL